MLFDLKCFLIHTIIVQDISQKLVYLLKPQPLMQNNSSDSSDFYVQ